MTKNFEYERYWIEACIDFLKNDFEYKFSCHVERLRQM